RGTPMIVQAMFLFYALRPVFHWTKLVAGIFVVSVNTGAYMAEIVRAGIQSLDKGQNEAARSIGMNNFQTMRHVVLPQAIRNAFPAIGNEFVVNIKDTSVLNVIGVTELYFQTTSVAGITYRVQDTFLVSAIIYLILTYSTTMILKIIERKMNMPVQNGPSSTSTAFLVFGNKREER
ncbi:MAG: amino acid ABC transporter permease, partial [Erysipelotrichaceae bacterium]|nr:amino acid ABC transporter permease [Erysipelotrichaceae bacterium]